MGIAERRRERFDILQPEFVDLCSGSGTVRRLPRRSQFSAQSEQTANGLFVIHL